MFLYNLGIHFFNFGLHLASSFKPKAKLWVNGRKNWREELQQSVNKLQLEDAVWIHCASLGEFEQGRPVIEKLRSIHPNQKIVLTFFSPSGFEIQKKYAQVDYVCYLPVDTKSNARDFLEIVKPKVAIFVKYEFWLNFLFQLKDRNIPTFLISTVIKKHQSFFKWYGGNFRKALRTYHTIYTQDNQSLDLLHQLQINTGQLAGDTRFDRVLEIGVAPSKHESINQFMKDSFVIIAGSSWQKDEDVLIEAYLKLKPLYSNIKLIFAPHEIDLPNIERLKKQLQTKQISCDLFTEQKVPFQSSVLILDTMGMLSSIYQYGNVAFIGGGFNNGIHNLLEPSVFGLPVLFGPNHQKFNEANELINLKAGFEIANDDDFVKFLTRFLTNEDYLKATSTISRNYVVSKSGGTAKIIEGLNPYFN